jgi:nucleoside-diphosphate-sugar epimerase
MVKSSSAEWAHEGGSNGMRVLITGSAGQLGREIARQLRLEHEVIGLDLVAGEATTHVGSVTDGDLVRRLTREVEVVIHTASLHAPHVGQRSRQEFVDVNISGTLQLLEAVSAAGIQRFVYTSTTSVNGFALVPGDRAVWVTEDLTPRPRDIYDITKLAAEELCRHVASTSNLPTIILRTSRFFAESPERVAIFRLYRGADVRDIAAAHVLAATDRDLLFGLFNISAHSPFVESDTAQLLHDAPTVIRRYFPEAEQIFARRGWHLPPSIDRVYVTERAERELSYRPRHNFAELLGDLDGTEGG